MAGLVVLAAGAATAQTDGVAVEDGIAVEGEFPCAIDPESVECRTCQLLTHPEEPHRCSGDVVVCPGDPSCGATELVCGPGDEPCCPRRAIEFDNAVERLLQRAANLRLGYETGVTLRSEIMTAVDACVIEAARVEQTMAMLVEQEQNFGLLEELEFLENCGLERTDAIRARYEASMAGARSPSMIQFRELVSIQSTVLKLRSERLLTTGLWVNEVTVLEQFLMNYMDERAEFCP